MKIKLSEKEHKYLIAKNKFLDINKSINLILKLRKHGR
jgi:hypothetical protein